MEWSSPDLDAGSSPGARGPRHSSRPIHDMPTALATRPQGLLFPPEPSVVPLGPDGSWSGERLTAGRVVPIVPRVTRWPTVSREARWRCTSSLCRGGDDYPVGCYQHEVKRTARAVERENPNWQLEPLSFSTPKRDMASSRVSRVTTCSFTTQASRDPATSPSRRASASSSTSFRAAKVRKPRTYGWSRPF